MTNATEARAHAPRRAPAEPNRCADCGVPIGRTARRCRLHANRLTNATKPGTFTPDTARGAVAARTTKYRGALEAAAEAARLRAELEALRRRPHRRRARPPQEPAA